MVFTHFLFSIIFILSHILGYTLSEYILLSYISLCYRVLPNKIRYGYIQNVNIGILLSNLWYKTLDKKNSIVDNRIKNSLLF